MKREELEAKMIEMLDQAYTPEQEEQLLRELKAFPNLEEEWKQLSSNFVPASRFVEAFPEKPAREENLKPIREALEEKAQLRRWDTFTKLLAAAAVVVAVLSGTYVYQAANTGYTPEQISGWIYAQEQEQAFFEEQYLLSDRLFLPEALNTEYDEY